MNATILAAALACGQSCDGGCGLPLAQFPSASPGSGTNARPVGRSAYAWLDIDGKPGWLSLTDSGRQVGAYSVAQRQYYPKNADGSFGQPGPVPVELPAAQRSGPAYNGGVALDKLSPGSRFTLNGRPSSEAAVYQAIAGDGPINDDSAYRRLYICHPDPTERLKLKAAAEAAIRSAGQTDISLLVLDPTHFLVAEYGFQPNPTGLTMQLVTPKNDRSQEIWRVSDWPAADVLTEGLKMRSPATFGGLRGSDASYDPAKSRGIRSGVVPGVPDDYLVLGGLAALVVAVALAKRSGD